MGERRIAGLQRVEFAVERRDAPNGGVCRRVTISTQKPVRVGGGVAMAEGAVLEHFLQNPVVMWAHRYGEPPIARCTALTVERGTGIQAEFEFPTNGVYPFADTVRQLWDAGFINAASIGFEPLEWRWEKQTVDGRRGTEEYPVFTKWELYEFSLVSIPRDREALRRAMTVLSEDSVEPQSALSVLSAEYHATDERAGGVYSELSTRYSGPREGRTPARDALDLPAIYRGLKALREVLR